MQDALCTRTYKLSIYCDLTLWNHSALEAKPQSLRKHPDGETVCTRQELPRPHRPVPDIEGDRPLVRLESGCPPSHYQPGQPADFDDHLVISFPAALSLLTSTDVESANDIPPANRRPSYP